MTHLQIPSSSKFAVYVAIPPLSELEIIMCIERSPTPARTSCPNLHMSKEECHLIQSGGKCPDYIAESDPISMAVQSESSDQTSAETKNGCAEI